MLHLPKDQLQRLGAEVTTREIKQQPELWQEAFDYYQTEQERIDAFLDKITEKHGQVRVILTGAGSSAYVGESLLPFLKEYGDEARFQFQAVATTDIVTNPKSYFKKDFPTILVSYARSGNSPESVASVQLGEQIVEDFYQITITCAKEGKLAQNAQGDENNCLILMPERSNDQGFAMTGSFTCMTLTTALIFDQNKVETKRNYVAQIIELANHIIEEEEQIKALVDQDFERVTYFGSGPFAGVSREVQLKILELTAGAKSTQYESSLGFRHGPKSFVNETSLIFGFVSNDPYTRQYDLDMLKELQADDVAYVICAVQIEGEDNYDGTALTYDTRYQDLPDGYLTLPFTLVGQIVSLLTAVKVENTPDEPSANKTVNRVVQGVVIYPFKD